MHLCVGGTPFCLISFSFTFSVHCRGPTFFCLGSPILRCFIFVCCELSSPLTQYCRGVILFCTILFFCSFNFYIPGCYPRWCGVSVGLLSLFPLWWGVGCGSCWGVFMSLPLIDRHFVGDAWCVMWHINLYPGRKKKQELPCFALLFPWRSITHWHLGAWAGKKGKLFRVTSRSLCFVLVVGPCRQV